MRRNHDVLLRGHDCTSDKADLRFKLFMMNVLILVTAGMVAVLTLITLPSVTPLRLGTNIAYISLALLAFWLLRRNRQYQKLVSVTMLVAGMVAVYVNLWQSPEEPLRIMWLLMIVAFAYFIEGRRAGYTVALISTVLVLSLWLFAFPALDLYGYLLILAFTGLLVFLTEMYERRVQQVRRELQASKRQLENQVQHEIRRHMTLYTQTNRELKALAKALASQKNDYKKLAHYDPLTGLANRTLFFHHFSQMIERAEKEMGSLALVFMDMDNFKQINDSLGHSAGDDVLKEIAGRLRETVGDGNMFARFGGDEFIVLLEGFVDRADLEMRIRQLADRLNRPAMIQGREIHISLSMGVALYPQDGLQIQELLKYADAAMYSAKEAVPDRIRFYSRELTRQSLERLTLESHLLQGIDREQFELYYQPQIDLGTGAIVSVEALLRWNDPRGGFIGPDTFISAAEEGILIHRLGKVIFEHAAGQMSRWEKEGIAPSRMAVNVSVVQLQDPTLIPAVEAALARCSLPGWLELEITESFTFHDQQEAITVLRTIRELGVGLAIDDFGKGYSALTHLKDLPVDRLKIDKAFVRDIVTDRRNKTLVQAIITMAEGLGLGVVAEGIEQRDQLRLLAKMGCQEGQGYLIGRPMSAEAIAPLLRQGRIDPG